MFSVMEAVGNVVHYGSVVCILCSTTTSSSKVANQDPTTELAFLISFIQSFAILCLVARHNRLIKHLEHQVAYTEGLEPPEEVLIYCKITVKNTPVSN